MKFMIAFLALLAVPLLAQAQEIKRESVIMENVTNYHWNEASQPMIKEGNFSIVNEIKTIYLGTTITRQGDECFRTITKLKGTTNIQVMFHFPNGDIKKVDQSIPNIEKTKTPTACN